MKSDYNCHSMAKKHHNNHIFEIFLFVNPIDPFCLELEEELLRFVANSDKKIYFRLVSCVDHHFFWNYFKTLAKNKQSLEERNELYQCMYKVSLGYKAALCQGKKRGRTFLMTMQEVFGCQKKSYSLKRMEKYAKKIGLDFDMWMEDLYSKQTREDVLEDLQLSHQMEIVNYPSLVIFDNLNYQYGLRIEDAFTAQDLEELTTQMLPQAEKKISESAHLERENKSQSKKKSHYRSLDKDSLKLIRH